jgi:hypothetical protein
MREARAQPETAQDIILVADSKGVIGTFDWKEQE